ncbi:hypothetical protein [Kribbella sp. VKM Ac-2568]|uniref:hypothetical protein n=1 Tax=Kribbella sp. VKM Ac-2568 TaxID=2512219 RepID=UPI0010540D4E|nr:hypothetical protein [Kribbella sp. VKM Ac-2568]TCM49086.1 hypothetical protein EV648_103355 [Kribbella sp. VKM Ac-2568]
MVNAVVRFADYRTYEAKRIEASNAMMGLLAGAQLASHLLQLTAGSERLLPEVFPRVRHIRRFNLTTEDARQILDAADAHLGAMSVPYSLALHEDYLKTCLDLLVRGGCCSRARAAAAKGALARQHAGIADATGGAFNPDSLAQLDTLRLMRNCMIHDGSRASRPLIDHIATWTASTEAGWVKLTGRTLKDLQLNARIQFGHPELILSLAVTKSLAREANCLLQVALAPEIWADLLIEDVRTEHPDLKGEKLLRKARGFARFHYGPLRLTDALLADAIARD